MEEKVCGSCNKKFRTDEDFLTGTSQWRVCTSENLWFNCSCGSTLMLPKGRFSWYSPTLGMSNKAASIFNKMAETRELPHIPSAVLEIQKLLLDSEIDTSVLAVTLKKDPLLATEVLRVFENLRKIRQGAKFSKGEPSLEHAINFIGRKHLGNLVMAASIKKFTIPTKLFKQESFWDEAFQTAAISELLTGDFAHDLDKDAAYLSGSLCNIGKVVSALYYPEKTDQVVQILSDVKSQCTWQEAETRASLASHCVLGEIGAAFWGLSPFVMDVIKLHHDPKEAEAQDPFTAKLCHITCLANIISHWINLEPHRINKKELDLEIEYFAITRADLEKLVSKYQKTLEHD